MIQAQILFPNQSLQRQRAVNNQKADEIDINIALHEYMKPFLIQTDENSSATATYLIVIDRSQNRLGLQVGNLLLSVHPQLLRGNGLEAFTE
jgi:hypothetical protein